jgi:hypothetical protein
MTPPDESTPSATPAHKFPPGLDFLDSIRKAQQTEDLEMRSAILWTFLQNVRDHADLLRKHGYDPERLLSLEGLLRNAAAADKKLEAAQEQLLQAAADLADAEWQIVDEFEKDVNAAAEERPFDLQVDEAKELLEELRKQYPKID